MAKKGLSASEYLSFNQEYQKLKTSLDADKDQKLNSLYDRVEQNLIYVGATAIEDKLQEGVPKTIERIMEANIRMWVLTGDK